MTLCKWCGSVRARTPLGFCGISCSTKWRNHYKNPMTNATPEAKARVSEAAKKHGTSHMLTAEARAKAIPKISAANRGRASPNKGKAVSQEVRDKISKTLEGRFAGPNNPNWKGVGTDRDWKSARYKRFIRAVWQAAKGLCESCGVQCAKGRKTNVHHKKSWDEFPSLRYDTGNGQLLCARCHRNLHPHEFDEIQRQKISFYARTRRRESDGKFL